MGYIGRFKKGARTLNVDGTGRVKLAPDFVPPTTHIVPMTAAGLSVNRTGGAELVGRRAANRDYSFGVIATGSSNAECERALQDIDYFLQQAGDEDEPLYFEWRSTNTTTYEPLWGQFGANLRCIVVHGSTSKIPGYGDASLREKAIKAAVNLQIKPYALGKQQRLATATGAIIEDVYGTTDGRSRGIILASGMATAALGNEIDNPVYGAAAYDTNWVSDATLTVSKNTDPEFLLWGAPASVKIISRAANQEHYQVIDTADTNTHILSCYAKLPDGSAVTSTAIVLYYNATLTTTYTPAGNGWYRLSASVTGIAAAINTGAQIKDDHTVYLTGWQFEENSVITPFGFGDMMGHYWSGTAHASATTRTAGHMKLPYTDDTFSISQGTIRIVWNPAYASNASGDRWLFEAVTVAPAATLSAHYESAGDLFEFTDSVSTAQSSAQTFSAGTPIVLHFTYHPTGGLDIYINGAANGSAASYSVGVPGIPVNLYIGTDSAAANHSNGTFMDFTIYDRAMTATEVANDYANITQVTADNQQLMPIPYIWTKDADNVVDNYDLGTTADHYCVCGGIPGSAPAITLLKLQTSAATWGTVLNLWLSNLDMPIYAFRNPAETVFFNCAGTATAGTDVNSDVTRTSVNTAVVTIGSASVDLREFKYLEGRELTVLFRATDAGANLLARLVVTMPELDYTSVEDQNVSSSATMLLLKSPELNLPYAYENFYNEVDVLASTVTYAVKAYRSAAGAANVDVDYIALFPSPFAQFALDTGEGGLLYLSSPERLAGYDTSSNVAGKVMNSRGDVIELLPDKLNVLLTLQGGNTAGATPTITYTITYSKAAVTPRWVVA